MNDIMVHYQWEIFIAIEIISFLCLLLFGYSRYKLKKPQLSIGFIIAFIALTGFEAVLAWYVFARTGEIAAFQIIVSLFVLYALTFGFHDFKRLDRWMRKKIDADRLLTTKDYEVMARQKDPTVQAKHYLVTWITHVAVFLSVQVLFFGLSGLDIHDSANYLTDLDWLGSESYEATPYDNQTFHSVSMIWGIILVVDAIVSATYVFQKKDKKKRGA
ncbi:hypothetical protein [Geomicrobium sp. JCM 19038]|uniref:hypothetical protein n=1 Tax=Geomicrobium sp. JCM 19038 TaxID=1460635 RepID=UPI00045F331E|nr:hypothetical protein [Geomicrobium sp. JCM 19038]GAK08770.1 hypothetical protein JCM19038_2565 [Geomicrobium sp. JCM 19038]